MSDAPPESDDPRLGTLVADKYRVDELIGRGGMGAVYRATHSGIGKRVALKFLDRDAARDERSVSRFQREAQAASAVESAHIVQIFDSGTSDGQPYLVMEYLHGEDARARLKREERLPLADALHIISQVLRALSRTHKAGILHRDLKPDNLFLCRRDDDPVFVKIVDFGISKVARRDADQNTLTRRGTVLGTAYYMSPEQAQAFPDIDERADLYSVGAILYELLAGRPPHTGSVYEAVLVDICTKDAPDVREFAPDVPDAIAKVLKKTLSRNRDQRYRSASELHAALAQAAPSLIRSSTSLDEALDKHAPSFRADGDREGFGTAGGTTLQSSARASRTQARRTLVAAVVAALAAFSITVLLMQSRKPDSPSAAGSAEASVTTSPPQASTSAIAIEAVEGDHPDAGADAEADAQSPSIASARPTTIRTVKTVRPAPRPGPKPPSTQPTTKPGKKPGVAGSLELDTSGP